MNFFLPSAIVFLGIVLVGADKIPIHDCGSKLAKITSIDVQPCPTIPCPFKKGSTANVTVEFEASASFTSAESSVHGILGGIPVRFPLKVKDACNNMKCPIKSGDKVLYKNSVAVRKEYPTIGVVVKWEIVTGKDEVLCFTVPVKILS
ncbi:hypothetical protein EGW08_016494 [Elysia chlorotica]|uniref:MD-2-related lipid-recognition domain-containing protein n=1 Tax=Elysia chlorotica TaxID=188477 RepID=A0A3S0ZUS9_ELYCH|nr:hypothetical protein EGW08_016494 [Elysia chlorotica]